jgi:hypothetical protein
VALGKAVETAENQVSGPSHRAEAAVLMRGGVRISRNLDPLALTIRAFSYFL